MMRLRKRKPVVEEKLGWNEEQANEIKWDEVWLSDSGLERECGVPVRVRVGVCGAYAYACVSVRVHVRVWGVCVRRGKEWG